MNARFNLPDGITDTQSFTWVLREVFVETLQAIPFFGVFTFRRTPALPVQLKDLPTLAVYLLDENMTPDGDANAGAITFVHDFRIGFSSVIQNNNPDEIEQKLDLIFWAIMNGLWRNKDITNRLDTRTYPGAIGTPDNVRFEGVMRGMRRHKFGSMGLNNETPIAEMQYEATLRYRADFAPTITDDLNLIHLQTAFPVGGTPAEIAAVQQVVYPVDLTSAAGAKSDVKDKSANET